MSSKTANASTGRLLLRIKNRASKRRILYRTVTSFMDNDLLISAAAISYFGMLVLFPALLLVLSLSQQFFGTAFYLDVLARLRAFLPGSYEFVRRNIEAISQVSTGILVTSFLVLLWAGSWIFTVIERAMCRIWGTHPRAFWHGRLLTIGMIAAVGVLLMASVMFTSGVIAVQTAAERLSVRPIPPVARLGSALWQAALAALGLLLTIILFGLIYRFMPNTQVKVIEVLPGAIIAGALWEVAKYGFAWSIPYFHYDLLYGSIGAGVALLTWSYLSSLIMLFGAQLTAVLHCRKLFAEDMEEAHEARVPRLEARVNK
jgi:membrane protein